MAKRKHVEDVQISAESGSEDQSNISEESSSDEETDLLDVEFEWFDPQPKHDFEGIKLLLRQLFDDDAQSIDLSALTDLILSQPLLGSTVKVEGNESDPYAFLTVLNLNEHRKKPVISNLITYVQDRASANEKLRPISEVLTDTAKACVGLVLTERLMNVPVQVVPPMYDMLQEEISWALEEKEPYDFTHFLIFSKTYREVLSTLDDDESGPKKSKKQRKSDAKTTDEVFFFHPEDEILQKHADAFGGFEYKHPTNQSDSKRTFQELGIMPQGYAMLVEANKLEPAIKAMKAFVGQD